MRKLRKEQSVHSDIEYPNWKKLKISEPDSRQTGQAFITLQQKEDGGLMKVGALYLKNVRSFEKIGGTFLNFNN